MWTPELAKREREDTEGRTRAWEVPWISVISIPNSLSRNSQCQANLDCKRWSLHEEVAPVGSPIHYGGFLLLKCTVGGWAFQGFNAFFKGSQSTEVSGRLPWRNVYKSIPDIQQGLHHLPWHYSRTPTSSHVTQTKTKLTITRHPHYWHLFQKSWV